ncbi:MAG: hypothetical protein KF799_05520 [Bdellovibrionales bacterium]|nr:hypothetical protein [Bdellovibrionales bacterium]
MVKKKVSVKPKKYPQRSEDVPVTQKMLFIVRDDLKSEIRSLDAKFDARFRELDAKFTGIDARFTSIDAKFDGIDAKFTSIDARFTSIDARFDGIDARFISIDARFDGIDARLDGIDKRFDALETNLEARFSNLEASWEAKLDAKLESKLSPIVSEIHRLALLIEEQNARNKIVLDGLTGLFARQDRVETKVEELTKTIYEIKDS